MPKVRKVKKKKGKKGKKKGKQKVEFSLDDPVEEDDGSAEQAKTGVQINLQSGLKNLVNKAE